MNQSLYARLGGEERIATMVDDLVDRHAVHPVLAPRFRGRDLPKLKQLATQFFCMGGGGPQVYEGRDMRSAHAGMNISEQEFMAVLDDTIEMLDAHGVAQAEVNEVLGILYSMRGDIVRG